MLGSTGMVGHQLCKYLISKSEFILFDIARSSKFRNETKIIDVENKKEELEKYIKFINPDYIINCIGILVAGSNENSESAIILNSYLPHMLSRIARETDSRLIHISTDCVFSGQKGGYTESDYRDGQGAYALTKILGEVIDDNNLTLRTSIVGPELKVNGEGLFHWFMSQEGKIQGFTQAIWSGVTTIELAKIIIHSINQNLTGLYHISNNTSISKFELLQLFKKYSKKNIEIEPFNGEIINKSLIDTRLTLDYKIPTYDKMIFDMIRLIANNKSTYSEYYSLNFE